MLQFIFYLLFPHLYKQPVNCTMESFFFLLIFTCLELSTGYSTLSFNSFTSLLSSQLNYDLFIIFPVAHMVKNPPIIQETGFEPWVGKIPWRRAWQPTPVFLPGESPWTEEPGGLQSMGWQRVRMTERLSTHTAYILVLMGILCQIFVLFMSFFFFLFSYLVVPF